MAAPWCPMAELRSLCSAVSLPCAEQCWVPAKRTSPGQPWLHGCPGDITKQQEDAGRWRGER